MGIDNAKGMMGGCPWSWLRRVERGHEWVLGRVLGSEGLECP